MTITNQDRRNNALYDALCTPPSACTLTKALGAEESLRELDFYTAEPSTAERSQLLSSCSTHFYLDDDASSLTCEEALASPCSETDATALQVERSTASAPLLSSTSCCRDSVARMIMNEARRQWEVRPSSSYLERHSISEDMRRVAVSWLAEVTAACNLKPSTLVLAASYLDRFLSVAKGVTSCMLQLIAVAALSLAAKQEEVLQPTSEEWTSIAANAFKVEHLVEMEWVVFHHLRWRGRTPTALGFLNLYVCGLDASSNDSDVLKTARYLVELSILDFKLLQHDYSTIAAAALVVAHQSHHLLLNTELLLALAPFLSLPDVNACAKELWQLHSQAASVPSA